MPSRRLLTLIIARTILLQHHNGHHYAGVALARKDDGHQHHQHHETPPLDFEPSRQEDSKSLLFELSLRTTVFARRQKLMMVGEKSNVTPLLLKDDDDDDSGDNAAHDADDGDVREPTLEQKASITPNNDTGTGTDMTPTLVNNNNPSSDSAPPPCHPPVAPAYDPQRNDYVAGDVVEIYNTRYTCRPNPYEKYCSVSTLDRAKAMTILMDENNEEELELELFDNENEDEDEDEAEKFDLMINEVLALWINAWKEVEGGCDNDDDGDDDAPTRPSNTTELDSMELPLSNAPTVSPVIASSASSSSSASDVPSGQPSTFPSRQQPSSLPSMRKQSMRPSTSRKPSMLPNLASGDELPSSSAALPSVAMTSSSPTWNPTTQWPTYHPTLFPTMYPTANPTLYPTSSPSDRPTPSPTTPAPTSSPSSSPLVISPTAYIIVDNSNQSFPTTENMTSCASSQIQMRIELVTDNYPMDISWQFIDRTNNIILLASPIAGYTGKDLGSNQMESQVDIRDICLDSVTTTTTAATTTTTHDATTANAVVTTANKYEFVIEDSYGDGVCCRTGIVQGYYKLLQYDADNDDWNVLVVGSNFKSYVVNHHFELRRGGDKVDRTIEQAGFTERPLPNSDGDNSNSTILILPPASSQLEIVCPSPQRKITIEVQTDQFGNDTSWEFRVAVANGPVLARNDQPYENRVQLDRRDVCVDDSSLYEMIVKDEYGDGMCCRYESGHYKIFSHHPISDGHPDGLETILYGGFFMEPVIKHLINTTKADMTDRDVKWLNSHNKRRKYWHAYYNTSYVSLQWSEALKAQAQVWADTLLDSCGEGMHHDPQRSWGENAAGNTGSGGWGTKREPDKIVARFVDYEVDDPWPANGHLTQVLWRSSKYVGCAESHKLMTGINQCHTQVCRYARTGNCNMAGFTNQDGIVDWKTAMLQDASNCGPFCPTDGCHA